MKTVKTSLAEKRQTCWWLRSIAQAHGLLSCYEDSTPVFVDIYGFPENELFAKDSCRTDYLLSILCKI